jgi:hypothetical protein
MYTKLHRPASVPSPTHPIAPRAILVGGLALMLAACGGSSGGKAGSGGNGGKGSGGQGTGGQGTGGQGTGGQGTGGQGNGGTAGSGGSTKGGNGGTSTAGSGGSAKGGSGGTATGGSGGTAGSGGQAGSGGAAGSGGQAGSGGTGGSTGSAPSAAADLKCKDPVYGDVSIPGTQVISDFETSGASGLLQYVQDGRGKDALPWYAYADDDQNDSFNIMATPGTRNPINSSNAFQVDTSVHGPCSSKGALHVKSPGPGSSSQYVGWGIDFMARPLPDKKKLAYDGSKYTGVGFWAKCSKDLQFSFEKVVDAAQDADISTSVVSSPCKYSDSTCNQYGVKNTVFTKDWSYHKMFFSELLQDPNGKTFTSGIDPKKLIAFQIHVNPFSPRTGSPTVNPIDCYFDDVHFLTEAAPKVPTETVTWSVEGTKIKRNGSEYKIRGLVRPSMEWDCAGFGVTREDAQRIKAWHANAVRLAVKDTLWAGGSTGSATCDGGAYQRQVKRAVNWLLEQKMDVILDLHYVGNTPTDAHTTFWDTISKDSFFKDGRIIFELYNEPSGGDFTGLRNWMNSTIAKIRANGAKNLILVSGPDYTYDLSGYVTTKVTDSANATAYAVHPYIFKPDPNSWKTACAQLPVVATEFGDAKVPEIGHDMAADKCEPATYSNYISAFESIGMGWTSWAWIVDEWGCGFPQLLADYSGTPNAIGTPVKDQLTKLNP